MRVGSKKENIIDNNDEKKIVRSIQINAKLWNEFDTVVENLWGRYKKSYIIEDMIAKYLKSQKID